ncbi:MAG: hypothetical protein EOP05_13075 [Proteobacteria bacterium]|nr:MAG: hypothetical protein EOP05_13075 [Pseudomonadota bacterium]
MKQIMRGLYKVNANGKVEKDLAKSLKQTSKSLVLEIAPNIKWSDGVPLVAQHFVDSIERTLNSKNPSAAASYLSFIKTVRALDTSKFEISLSRPIGYAEALFTHPALFPIRKETMDQEPTRSLLGPFTVASRKGDQSLTLVPNPYYSPKPLNSVEIRFVENDTTAESLFESKIIDVSLSSSAMTLRNSKDLHRSANGRVVALVFNTEKTPFNSIEVRRALEAGLKKADLVKALGAGQAPTSHWISGLFREAAGSSESRTQTSLGRSKVKFLERVKLTIVGRDDAKLVAEIIQAQLKTAFKITVEIEALDLKTYLAKLRTGEIQMALFGWTPGFPDAINELEVFTSSGQAKALFKNAEYDKLVLMAAAAQGAAKDPTREAAEKYLLRDQAALIPLYEDIQLNQVSPKIQGAPKPGAPWNLEVLKKVPVDSRVGEGGVLRGGRRQSR